MWIVDFSLPALHVDLSLSLASADKKHRKKTGRISQGQKEKREKRQTYARRIPPCRMGKSEMMILAGLQRPGHEFQIEFRRNFSDRRLSIFGFFPGNLHQSWVHYFKFHQFSTYRTTGRVIDLGQRRPTFLSAKDDTNNPETHGGKYGNVKFDLAGKAQMMEKNHVNKTVLQDVKHFLNAEVEQKTVISRYPERLATIFVFDIETTGFSKDSHRIIEIALRDLIGGHNSTFQTLVNPERYVPNTNIHGIDNLMVTKPGVPRWKELVPILMNYVSTRRKHGRPVLWIAHNGNRFDFPFLFKEFERCSVKIPPDWLFLDSLSLARECELVNPDGSKLKSMSLESLRTYYDVKTSGPAHRAMADVNALSMVLQGLTHHLKLPVSGLLDRSRKASDFAASD